MTVRQDYSDGRTHWSVTLVHSQEQEMVLWSFQGMKWKRGLPALAHLEQGSMLWSPVLDGDCAAAEALYECARMLRCR